MPLEKKKTNIWLGKQKKPIRTRFINPNETKPGGGLPPPADPPGKPLRGFKKKKAWRGGHAGRQESVAPGVIYRDREPRFTGDYASKAQMDVESQAPSII